MCTKLFICLMDASLRDLYVFAEISISYENGLMTFLFVGSMVFDKIADRDRSYLPFFQN